MARQRVYSSYVILFQALLVTIGTACATTSMLMMLNIFPAVGLYGERLIEYESRLLMATAGIPFGMGITLVPFMKKTVPFHVPRAWKRKMRRAEEKFANEIIYVHSLKAWIPCEHCPKLSYCPNIWRQDRIGHAANSCFDI